MRTLSAFLLAAALLTETSFGACAAPTWVWQAFCVCGSRNAKIHNAEACSTTREKGCAEAARLCKANNRCDLVMYPYPIGDPQCLQMRRATKCSIQ